MAARLRYRRKITAGSSVELPVYAVQLADQTSASAPRSDDRPAGPRGAGRAQVSASGLVNPFRPTSERKSPTFARRLEALDGIAVRIFDLNPPATRGAFLHLHRVPSASAPATRRGRAGIASLGRRLHTSVANGRKMAASARQLLQDARTVLKTSDRILARRSSRGFDQMPSRFTHEPTMNASAPG